MVSFDISGPRVQVGLERTPFHASNVSDGSGGTQFFRVEARYLLRFPGLADFEISADGRAVVCHPTPETSDSISRHLYINQVLPLVLGRLGKLVFHASAVEVGAGAVAFVGASTLGKSTLAASFATSGAAVITDESLVLDEREAAYWVTPGHPSVRLWEDSETALIAPGVEAAPSLPFTAKRRLLAGSELRFSDRPTRLRRMYFLGDGGASTLRLKPMDAAAVMLELVKTSFLLNTDDRSRVASHFDEVARLANQPIHYRLDFPRRFDLLPSVRRAIIDHASDGAG
jgi:hypothetical protein